MSDAPVGVFDSGLGGLSVAREIRAMLPSEHLLYFADSANCPYGGRPLDEIGALTLAAARELIRRGVKLMVVACNTASGAALETLRSTVSIPIVGLEPAVKPAAAFSHSGRIGVMATAATLKTERFERLTRNFARDVSVVTQPCPGLVELVEAGEVGGERVRAVLEPLVEPLRRAGVDTVVLGCTHYPFLRSEISEMLGADVLVLDSGGAVARQVERVLRDRGALARGGQGSVRLVTTGNPEVVGRVASNLWGDALRVEQVGDDYPFQVRSSGGPPSAGSST